MSKPKPHGGKRPGSGRKPSGMKRYNVILDDLTVSTLKSIANGNLSKGIRLAADALSIPAPTP